MTEIDAAETSRVEGRKGNRRKIFSRWNWVNLCLDSFNFTTLSILYATHVRLISIFGLNFYDAVDFQFIRWIGIFRRNTYFLQHFPHQLCARLCTSTISRLIITFWFRHSKMIRKSFFFLLPRRHGGWDLVWIKLLIFMADVVFIVLSEFRFYWKRTISNEFLSANRSTCFLFSAYWRADTYANWLTWPTVHRQLQKQTNECRIDCRCHTKITVVVSTPYTLADCMLVWSKVECWVVKSGD